MFILGEWQGSQTFQLGLNASEIMGRHMLTFCFRQWCLVEVAARLDQSAVVSTHTEVLTRQGVLGE